MVPHPKINFPGLKRLVNLGPAFKAGPKIIPPNSEVKVGPTLKVGPSALQTGPTLKKTSVMQNKLVQTLSF